MSKRHLNLKRLLKPRHIAFVGGSHLAPAILSSESIGFDGEIWIVNPKHASLGGRPCYRSIAELPAAPDAAFVAVRNELAVEAIRELANAGAGGVVCYAAGFAEVGGRGERLQEALKEAAGDLALVGPNCYGVLNYLDGAALWPDSHGGRACQRGVAIVSQSGNLAMNMTMSERSVPFAYVISVGNQAVLEVGDYIEALIEDPRVSAIGLYLEGLSDVAGFSRAAARSLEHGIPIAVLKCGTSAIGSQLTLSHTSSLAGSDQLYQALFDRLGVIRVESVTQLLETLKLVAVSGPAPGPRLGVLTCSGGDSAITADLADELGLSLDPLNAAQAASLREQLPDFATVSNPLDYNASIWGDSEALERCFATMMADGTYDATLLVLDYPRPGVGDDQPWDAAVDAMLAARRTSGRMAAVAAVVPELLPKAARERLAADGVAPLQGIRDALKALGDSARYSQYRRRVLDTGRLASLLLPETLRIDASGRTLDEWESKRRLARFGLAVPEGRLVSAAEAPAAAAELTFPVVVKAVSDRLAHKTELGAVRLNVGSAEAVKQAVAEVAASMARVSGAGERFLVERMTPGAVAELIIGLKREPPFDLALVVGCGGVLVELFRDCATLLLPTDRDSVARALDSLKGAQLLAGFRGRPAGDREAVIDAIMAVAAFAGKHRRDVLELDVNPLLVLPRGQGAFAADAVIRVAATEPSIGVPASSEDGPDR